MSERGWLILLCIASAIILIVVGYFYSQQVQDCDKKGGVLVRGGLENVCVDPR